MENTGKPSAVAGLMKKIEFVYDEHYDCYLCSGGQELPIGQLQRKAIVNIIPIPFIVRNVRFYLSAPKVKTIRS